MSFFRDSSVLSLLKACNSDDTDTFIDFALAQMKHVWGETWILTEMIQTDIDRRQQRRPWPHTVDQL